MGFKRYHIPEHFWPTLEGAPELEGFSSEYTLADLLRESKFYIMPSKYMGGITFHKNFILLHQNFNSWPEETKLRILAHEGYHVAQQKEWGWFSFMWKYIREWASCGFNYNKMKLIGIEKAAYDYERSFA